MSIHETEWHAEDEQLAAYVAGRAEPVFAASLETHLIGCADCRGRLATYTPDTELAWGRLADVIDQPSRTWLLRSTIATPALLQAVAIAVMLVGVVPILVSAAAGDAGLVALLVLAPLAPVAAVALAYYDGSDPSGEISLATPVAGLRLVALRAVVVAVVALPLSFLVLAAYNRWIEEVPMAASVAWCLPGLALAALVMLAGTTRLDPTYVAVGASGAWALLVAAVVTVRRSLRPEVLVDLLATPGVQAFALSVVVAAVLLTVARRDAVSYRRI
ncbi:hypothetical protein [Nocardioides sp. SR21]|uniref:hypothetical protein n=1 Tax=Nocardioides sp. SR21 TaxID=2919501 RepID=UPI001FAA37F8|nr:hypothetical protein [Nocardioides sp. SR21]